MSEVFGIVTGLAASAGKVMANMFTGDMVAGIGTTNAVFVMMIFILFVFIIRKIMSTVISFLIVGIASASFPFAASYIGLSIPATPQTIVFFVVMGVSAYVVFIVGKYFLKMFGVFSVKKV